MINLEDLDQDARVSLLDLLKVAVEATSDRWAAERAIEALVNSDTGPHESNTLDSFIDGLAVATENVEEVTVDCVAQLVTLMASGDDTDEDEEEDDELGDCAVCEEPMTESGDNWGNLCPGCADRVSAYMDSEGIDGEAARDQAIEAVRGGWTPAEDSSNTDTDKG